MGAGSPPTTTTKTTTEILAEDWPRQSAAHFASQGALTLRLYLPAVIVQ
jgi:hypothetical protein